MFLTCDGFTDPGSGIRHGFFTRRGGVGGGIYASLNCSHASADEPEAVAENRRLALAALGGGELLTLNQAHTAECATVRAPWKRGGEPRMDAMATDRPGLVLGILTADCGPVLFHGRTMEGSPVIGAAHAGWGGAVGGVLEATIEAMLALGAGRETIRAALGPCIGPRSYEVSQGFERPFLDHDPKAGRFFAPSGPGKMKFDLPGYIAFRLEGAGVPAPSAARADTCAEERDFFSFRRATLRGEGDYGRQLSAIVISDAD